jgi:hypothetical protein
MSDARSLLRHTVATVAYRGGKAIRGVPSGFASFRASDTSRTPAQILAHMGDLFDWALAMASGKPAWHDSTPLHWDQECQRFHAALTKFDEYLASDAELHVSAEGLFQGPVADALNHVGQINFMRRMAGGPVRGENYFKADIQVGRCGAEQAEPRVEFE